MRKSTGDSSSHDKKLHDSKGCSWEKYAGQTESRTQSGIAKYIEYSRWTVAPCALLLRSAPMIKIRISYEQDQELEAVKELLAPVVEKVKIQPAKGKYKRAYIWAEPDKT